MFSVYDLNLLLLSVTGATDFFLGIEGSASHIKSRRTGAVRILTLLNDDSSLLSIKFCYFIFKRTLEEGRTGGGGGGGGEGVSGTIHGRKK